MNTIYENEIIENKMTELLNTRLDARALMTVDTSLTESAGLRKVINRYTYSGCVLEARALAERLGIEH
ncbi:MAG: hypothetical protein IKA43_06740, partial [Clostridia bacterium]|nr:hypothetical protein [Clostridia bacterium]